MSGRLWSRENDVKLWNKHSTNTSDLAVEFNRSKGGIRSRLKHLQDPSHKAYQRLFASAEKSVPTRKSSSLNNSNASERLSPGTIGRDQHENTLVRNPDPMCSLYEEFENICIAPVESIPAPRTELNAEQGLALDLILSGSNVFLTGAAGVGKSFLLRYVIDSLKKRFNEKSIAVTASTGIAATHIAGVTLHSWSGIGLGKDGASKLVQKVLGNNAACERWRTTRALILDEVSMIDGILFEALDQIGRSVRGKCNLPFGGLQVILCGDFFQLPPILLRSAGFAFEAPAWRNGCIKKVELFSIVRQKGNLEFINALCELRKGACSKKIEQLLETCHVSRKSLPTDGILPTKLFCTNKNVDLENNTRLDELTTPVRYFQSKDVFKDNYTKSITKDLLDQIERKIPNFIRLRIGAQVMLLKNTPEWKLVNGSRGVVVSFDDEYNGYPNVQFLDGKTHTINPFPFFLANEGGAMARSQLPLKLAWCWTVHKSQGMTLDRAELQLDDAFAFGQAYVALSRIKSLDDLWIRGNNISQGIVKAHPLVLDFYKNNVFSKEDFCKLYM
mmetsp:Transcript_13757/g.16866  ORF Transcript_13757/g.16866 Transcript_13757/m.16866 type:complete len:559 (-) Transcript_13757:28-1704(-)